MSDVPNPNWRALFLDGVRQNEEMRQRIQLYNSSVSFQEAQINNSLQQLNLHLTSHFNQTLQYIHQINSGINGYNAHMMQSLLQQRSGPPTQGIGSYHNHIALPPTLAYPGAQAPAPGPIRVRYVGTRNYMEHNHGAPNMDNHQYMDADHNMGIHNFQEAPIHVNVSPNQGSSAHRIHVPRPISAAKMMPSSQGNAAQRGIADAQGIPAAQRVPAGQGRPQDVSPRPTASNDDDTDEEIEVVEIARVNGRLACSYEKKVPKQETGGPGGPGGPSGSGGPGGSGGPSGSGGPTSGKL